MVIFLIILSAGCALATVLVLASTTLASRNNRSQPASEALVTTQNHREFTSLTNSIEVNV